jgi:hypothetical protein
MAGLVLPEPPRSPVALEHSEVRSGACGGT